MDNLVNEFPSEDNPFVNVGKEVRSKWVPVMGNHDDAGDGSNLARQMAYAGEALKQDHSGNVYWTAQGLHASDGTIVARNLGQAAQLLVVTVEAPPNFNGPFFTFYTNTHPPPSFKTTTPTPGLPPRRLKR